MGGSGNLSLVSAKVRMWGEGDREVTPEGDGVESGLGALSLSGHPERLLVDAS